MTSGASGHRARFPSDMARKIDDHKKNRKDEFQDMKKKRKENVTRKFATIATIFTRKKYTHPHI